MRDERGNFVVTNEEYNKDIKWSKTMDRCYNVYQIICRYNNKKYIGYTKNFSNKIIHKIRPRGECGTFLTDFLKYGEENFDIEIISPNLTEEEAQILKTYYIGKYQTGYPDGYNDGLAMLNGYELLTYTEQKFHRFTSKCYNGDDTPYQKYMKISEQMKRRYRRHE